MKRRLILLTILCVCLGKSRGQVSLHFTNDTIATAAGTVLPLHAWLVNKGEKEWRYQLSSATGSFELVTPPSAESGVLHAHDSLFILLQVFVPRKAEGGVYTTCALRAQIALNVPGAAASSIVQATEFFSHTHVFVLPQRNVYLTAVQPELYITPPEDSLGIPLHCTNTGNTPQTLHLTVTCPLTTERLFSTVSVSAFSDTVVTIRSRLPAPLLEQNTVELLVSGAYEDGALFSALSLRVFNTTSHKHFEDPNQSQLPNTDMAGVYERFIGSGSPYYEALGDGDIPWAKNNLHLRVDGFYYPAMKGGPASYDLMNTYADLHTPRWDVRAGNIYGQQLEMPLIGRGVEVTHQVDGSARLEAGYVNGSFNLLGNYAGAYYQPYNAAFAAFRDTLGGHTLLRTQAIQLFDPYNGENSSLAGGTLQFPTGKTQGFLVGGYGSYSTTAGYAPVTRDQWGGAGVLQYNGVSGHWQWMSNNYVSTRGYAGLQNGAVNLEEKISYNAHGGGAWWLRYDQYESHPTYLSPRFLNLTNVYTLRTAEAGMGWKNQHGFSGTLRPYYYYEYTQYGSLLFGAQGQSLDAGRLNLDLNESGLPHQSISFNADAGWSHASIPVYDHFFAWKITTTYQYKQFYLNTYLQHNPYYTSDLTLFPLTGHRYGLYTIGPGYAGTLFHRKLSLNVSDFLSYENSYKVWYNNLNAHAVYTLPKNWSLDVNYNKLKYGITSNLDIVDVGVVKKFGHRTGGGGGQGSLELFLFEDRNGNGQYDNGEPPARNILVRINDEVFTSDAEGRISYRDIPNGVYSVSILRGGGFFATPDPIVVRGKTVFRIPLHQMSVLKGAVLLERREHSYETDETVVGIRIDVKDPQGRTIEALTDEQGRFTVYLAEGHYTVELNASSLPDKYECPSTVQEITLDKTNLAQVTFHVMVQQRNIQVKKFFSPTTSSKKTPVPADRKAPTPEPPEPK